MIPNDQPLRKETIERMLKVCESQLVTFPDEYTKWEHDFIDSITTQFERKNDLSDRQCEILERIHDK